MSLQSIIVIILVGGWIAGRFFAWIGLPGVLGMILWGILIGFLPDIPQVLWDIAPFLKSLALIVILLRAGLGIKLAGLKKVGSVAIRMAFIPALLEIIALALMFHFFLVFDWIPAVLAATLLSAVSPAIVVPSMLALKEKGLGRKNEVPTMVLAGASLDDVIVITLFTTLMGLAGGGSVSIWRAMLLIPWSLALGTLSGLVAGFLLVLVFKRYNKKISSTEKIILLIGVSVMLFQLGEWTRTATLLGIMSMGFVLLARAKKVAAVLSEKLKKMWVISEIILFVLIGMSVRPELAFGAGPVALLLILGGLVARSIGVILATSSSPMTVKERAFAVIAYVPKATVQAALGTLPLQAGIPGGELILAYAVLSIILTAPLGLIGIRLGGRKLLDIELQKGDFLDDKSAGQR